MENASKALIMAGSMLIALMIIGALVLAFSNLSDYMRQNDTSKKSSQIAEFNNQYSPYDKKDLNLMELKSLYNKTESNNKKNPDEKIDTNILIVYPNIADDFKNLPEDDKQNCVFKCVRVDYNNPGGKISYMEFAKVK